jgi:hypothetical protein
MLEGRAEVQRVYEAMAARGIVDHVGEKHLGLFRTVRYPEKDHGPEEALLQKLKAGLGGKKPDARTRALAALLEAAGLHSKLPPSVDRRQAGKLADEYWPSRAVLDEVRMIRLAEAETAP